MAFFDFALETGEEEPIDAARDLLATAVSLADNADNVPLWWITKLCRHLIDERYDLADAPWESYVRSPKDSPDPNDWVTELVFPLAG